MTGIKDVTYDATSETARLGMGNRWGDVYAALDQYKRTVVGGRISPVGMALVTGGKSPRSLRFLLSAHFSNYSLNSILIR